MDIGEFKEALKQDLITNLTEVELRISNRPAQKIKGWDDDFNTEDDDFWCRQYQEELEETKVRLDTLHQELQYSNDSFLYLFDAYIRRHDLPIKQTDSSYKILYREYIRHNIKECKLMADMLKGSYEQLEELHLLDAVLNRVECEKDQISIKEQQQENGRKSGEARYPPKQKGFDVFKGEVEKLRTAYPKYSNADLATNANKKAKLDKSPRTLQGYVAKILSGEY